MVTQSCEWTKCHWTVHSKRSVFFWVNFTLIKKHIYGYTQYTYVYYTHTPDPKEKNTMMINLNLIIRKINLNVNSLCVSHSPWTVAHQAPLSMGFFRPRILEWVAISFARNHLSTLIKMNRLSKWNEKRKTHLHAVYKKPVLNIQTLLSWTLPHVADFNLYPFVVKNCTQE